MKNTRNEPNFVYEKSLLEWKNSRLTSIYGFTLIELMIVIAIIGLLTAAAIAIYSGFDCKTKQAEAKSNLATIYNGQTAFYVEYNKYANTLSDIGFTTKSPHKKHPTGWYNYDAGGNDQTFTAKALDGPNEDAWSIDQNKMLSNISPGCGG